jgi:hypothetical protein
MQSEAAFPSSVKGAAIAGFEELLGGIGHWRVAHLIGVRELRHRYSRSKLGQLWLMVSTAMMIGVLAAVWSLLWKSADARTRNYMFLRLAFAISTSVEPEILIMDEMVSTGDAEFLEKAERRLHEIVDKANILALASHQMDIIKKICNKVVWLEHGTIKQFGPSECVV